MLLGSLLLFFVLFAVEFVVRAVWNWPAMFSRDTSAVNVAMEEGRLIFTFANLLPAALGAVGVYRITTRYPILRSRRKDVGLRRLLRFVVVLPLVGLTVTALLPAIAASPAQVAA